LNGLSTVVADADVFSCELAGGKALLDLRTSTYYNINAVGAFVWERLGTPSTIAAIGAAMIDQFDVEADRCLSDLKTLVEQFADAGLVQVDNARAG
jgi:hypothetical protein